MTADALSASPRTRGGLLEKLLAAVRPEFRVDVYVPDPDDPVLGRPLCRGARLRPVRLGIRIVRRPRHPLACPGPPRPGGLPRRPGSAAARAERADAAARCRLPVRQQRIWAMHAPPQQLDRAAATRTRRPGQPAIRSMPAAITSSAGCRFAPCGWKTTGTCSASRMRPAGGSWAAPTSTISSRTASSAARPVSTSVASRRS